MVAVPATALAGRAAERDNSCRVRAARCVTLLRVNRPTAARIPRIASLATACVLSVPAAHSQEHDLVRLPYNHDGLIVDLGVGLWAWPLPMDYDHDGDPDLVVVCPDTPYNGTYFFENPGNTRAGSLAVFKPAVRISQGFRNAQVSYVEGRPVVLSPDRVYPEFIGKGAGVSASLGIGKVHQGGGKTRADQWRFADFDGNGSQDLIVGIGDWSDYGWDDAYNASGDWTNGPLHGHVYWLANRGTNASPSYAAPEKLEAGGAAVDVFGMPSPNLADFDGDGDLDLLCGEFRDGFTYFQNTGSRQRPAYAQGRDLGIRMELCMITPTAMDWDGDGDMDLICGDEDGRVAFIEHTGAMDAGLPRFLAPRYFQQQAEHVKFGALSTPVAHDWDGDGDADIVAGNTAGHIGFFENLGGGGKPAWAAPVLLQAGGALLRIMAGPNGSIQGPCEAKWGYTTLTIADWNGDGLPDIVTNSIWGRIEWFRNEGTRTQPTLAAAQPVRVKWNSVPPKPAWNWWDPGPEELVTQWRTTPVAIDWNRDGLTDLVMLDHEGYLAFFERFRADGELWLKPGARTLVDENGNPLRLNDKRAGGSGRRKLCLADWDGDGDTDLIVNSRNADVLLNLGRRDGLTVFANPVPLADRPLSSHTTSPTVVDWNANGIPDLLVGAEDGYFYHMAR